MLRRRRGCKQRWRLGSVLAENRKKGARIVIWTIAKKEFLEKILDARVTISFLIAITLTIVTTFVVGEDYQTKKTAYDQAIAKAEADLKEVKVFSQYKPDLAYSPSPLIVFSRGVDLPSSIVLNIRPDWVPRYEQTTVGSNPLMRIFDTLDVATVLRILFALLVILLTYDSFSGEKENGTLQMILSNPVSRVRVLTGKIIGALMIVAVVAVLTFVITLIVLQAVSRIALSSGDYLRAFIILVATLLYLAIFAILGSLASIRLHHSSTSLIVLLFLWFVVAILQPNASTYLASELKTVPRLEDIKPTLDAASESYLAELERLQGQYATILNDRSRQKYIEVQMAWGQTYLYMALADADYEILEYAIKQAQIYRKSVGAADGEWQLYKSLYLDKLDRQLHWKRLIDLISPAALFTHSAAVLSRTDIDNFEDFMKQAREFRNQYIGYLDGKGVFSTNAHLFFSRLTREQIDPAETERRLAQYAKDPSTIAWIRNQPPLDLTDSPRFKTQAYAVLDDVGKAGGTLFLLILYAVVLLALSDWSLRAYDVP